jgi:WD40 repeat protein
MEKMVQINEVKSRLLRLHSDGEELQVVIDSGAHAACGAACEEQEVVRAQMALAEKELDALVNAPVSGGHDPFEWLPDELIVMIMLMLLSEVTWLWGGVCERVCQRWARLVKSARVQRHMREEGRWAGYELELIQPRMLLGHTSDVYALCVGLDGKVYSGSLDGEIRVWASDGTHLQTLEGHTDAFDTEAIVCALAVGQDSKVYSGSEDMTIKVWSGDDGAHLQTLVGHTDAVRALAVGRDGKVYSGSDDMTVRVWSGDDGAHMQTLVGHTGAVCALAIALDGRMYSGSIDKTIRVWSGNTGARIHKLVGHTSMVTALAVGLNGCLYSASGGESRVRVWSTVDHGTALPSLEGHDGSVRALAVGQDGKVYSGSEDMTVKVWQGNCGHLLCTLPTAHYGGVRAIATMPDGRLLSAGINGGQEYEDEHVYINRFEMWQ